MVRRVLIVLALVLVTVALFTTVASAQTGDPAKGKTAWEQANCKGCHGANGEGAYAGPRAGDGKTVADWIKQARTPRQNMPAYAVAQASDQTLADMNAYMQTLPKPASFTPTQAQVAESDPAGKKLMAEKRCVACHANAAAFVKSRFTDQGRQVTADAMLKQLRTPAKAMPAFSTTQVTDAQAQQIADFLKSQAVQPAASAVPAAAATAVATRAATAAAAAPAAAATAKPATLPTTGGPAGAVAPLLALVGTAALGLGMGVRLLRRR